MRLIAATIKTIFIIALAFALLLFAHALNAAPVFAGGERYEFYLGDSSSSKIVCAKSPYEKLFLSGVTGESVRYFGDVTQKIVQKYDAEVLFTEEAANVVNYYCYSKKLKGGVELNGYLVNLHVATSGEETAAGTPVIFGGF